MTEQSTQTSLPIQCNSTHKLLARLDENFLYLWCKQCKAYHPLPWDMLQRSLEEMKHDQSTTVIMSA
jgi:hypothetical protein